jgi:hypothetical protein
MKSLFLVLLFFAETAAACPFCDEGGKDTILFVFTVFGLFALSMFFLLIGAARSGAFRNNAADARAVLIAENVTEDNHKQN